MTKQFKMAQRIKRELKKRGDFFLVATGTERIMAITVAHALKAVGQFDLELVTKQQFENDKKKGFKVVAI